MPVSLTMPDIPADFPLVTEEVWVWDTWPLTDEYSNQVSHRGSDIIFSLVAPREIPFDERHWSARIGWFIRCFDADPDSEWNDQGHVFEDDTSLSNTEWSGSARYLGDDLIRIFYRPPPSATSGRAPTASPPCWRPSRRSTPPAPTTSAGTSAWPGRTTTT